MTENQFWVRIWTIIGLTISVFAIAAFLNNAYDTRQFVTNNYCEVAITGHQGVAWQKCPR